MADSSSKTLQTNANLMQNGSGSSSQMLEKTGTTRNPAQISPWQFPTRWKFFAMLYRYHGDEHIGNICLNQEYLSGFAEAVVFSLINQWRICWEHVLLFFLGES